MTSPARNRLVWRQLHWHRPLEAKACLTLLRQLASDPRGNRIVFEVRGQAGDVEYFLGAPSDRMASVAGTMTKLLPGTAFTKPVSRNQLGAARQIKTSTHHRALRIDEVEDSARVLLAALAAVGKDEVAVLQVVLGPRRIPLAIPTNSPSSAIAPWWRVLWYGERGPIDSDKRTALRLKVSDHGYACAVRIGSSAATPARRQQLVQNVVSALRTSEAPGVRLKPIRVGVQRVERADRPGLGWPLRLNISEVLSVLGWPLGDSELPGQPSLHPRRLPPAPGTTTKGRVVATSTAPGCSHQLLRVTAEAARHHCEILGPTGVGKSNLMARLIAQDVADGRGIAVIEPRGDLVDDVLAHIPERRHKDVVVLDPADDRPVGLNPLHVSGQRPEVVADAVLSVFLAIYGEAALGPRSRDILHASLLTLTRRPDSSLVMLPLLLTNTGFRRSMTQNLKDPIALGPFWDWYEAMSAAERGAAIAPIMNKLRAFLLNPGLRAVLGQREPRFTMRQVLTERSILLIPLRRAALGEEAARLLGALAVAQLWQTIQTRTSIAPAKRHPVMVYIDEVQDFLHLPTDIGEALATARGLGVGFTLAHQHLAQLSPAMRAGIRANARTSIAFQLSHEDAVTLSKGHPEVGPEDFTSLGQYEVYASIFSGKVNPYASGYTLPPSEAISDPKTLRRLSRERYGLPLDEVEAGFHDLVSMAAAEPSDGTPGRRRRQP
jgi:hypothetical protein